MKTPAAPKKGLRAIDGALAVAFALASVVVVAPPAAAQTFGEDLSFLHAHVDVVLLEGRGGRAKVAVVPAWQGRVATSSARGDRGASFGWINRALIASRKTLPHMTPFGGEDRLWLGPEGGQFSLYFRKDEPFDFAHWQTPAAFDTEPFPVVEKGKEHVAFARRVALINRAGTHFDIGVRRVVRLGGAEEIRKACGRAPAPSLSWVAYRSENRLTNVGEAPWTRATGLPSIWILGMFNPTPRTTVLLPFSAPEGAAPDTIVNDAYFGEVPPDRLRVRGRVAYFRADGQRRSKVGLRPAHARSVLGSWDAGAKVLTVVSYDKPAGPRPYVSSLWELQRDPYDGDVVNAYNDGPPAEGGAPMGPFYELETSSPGAELTPGASLDHVHRTLHFQGPRGALDGMARACLGVPLAEIEAAFPATDPPAPRRQHGNGRAEKAAPPR